MRTVWFLGDSLTDMKAAVAGGCFPVHIGRLAGLDHETLRLIDQGKVMHCKGIETVAIGLREQQWLDAIELLVYKEARALSQLAG